MNNDMIKKLYEIGLIPVIKIENADDANPVGTPLNKATFEAMQTAIMPVVRSYMGNGEDYREIELDFEPSAVILLKSIMPPLLLVFFLFSVSNYQIPRFDYCCT